MLSRNWRLARLRETALPTALPTEKPNLLAGRELGRAFITNRLQAHELPFLVSLWNSAFLVSRRSLPSLFGPRESAGPPALYRSDLPATFQPPQFEDSSSPAGSQT